jgi:restriction endonuclease S subunit
MTGQRGLPRSWRWVRLGEVGRFDSGGTPPKTEPEYWGGGIPFVTGADVTSIYVSAKNARAFLTAEGLNSGKTAICSPGTILLVTRTRVGRVGIATETMGASQDLSPFVCGPQLHPEYVCRYLASISNKLVARTRGATIQGLTRDVIHGIELPLPSLGEQRRIAAILTERMAAIDHARAAAQAQLEAAQALPAAYLRAAFTSPEGKRGSGGRLADVLQLRKDVVHPHDRPSGPATFVGLEHIASGTGARVGSLAVEMAELTGRKPRFYAGDIVYGYLRPYLNKVWIAEFDGLCSVDQYVYRVDKTKADTVFVAWFMRSPVYLDRAPISTTPGQLPRIRTEEVAAVPLNIPPLADQRRIGATISKRMAAVEWLCRTLNGQLDLMDKLPAALLRQAFNGEL